MYTTISAIILTVVILLVGVACTPSEILPPKKWTSCTKSSNWTGNNASCRMMNMLSPNMPDAVFKDRLDFIKSRKCNYVNLILCNNGDGEYGKYSIYGSTITMKINKDFTNVMDKRIKKLRKEGFGIVLWLVTDDDDGWNKTIYNNFAQYVKDIKDLGWFDVASMVVLGLELDEYWKSGAQISSAINVLRGSFDGKVGVHQKSGHFEYAAYADVMFFQLEPKGLDPYKVETSVKNVIEKTKKPVCMFELDRVENRAYCEVAMRHGAFSVGNW